MLEQTMHGLKRELDFKMAKIKSLICMSEFGKIVGLQSGLEYCKSVS